MRRMFFALYIVILAFSPTIIGAESLKYKIETAINEIDPHLNIGIKVVNISNKQILYENNSARYYNFASSMKVLLTANAIEYFGEEYEFQNKIFKVNENYYLDIGDDPAFSDEDLKNLIQQLKNSKINTINGNFYIIKRDFKLPSLSPDKVIVDGIYCYGAHVSRTHINKNCFPLTVKPGKVGEKVQINSPHQDMFKILNEAKTIQDNAGKARIRRFIDGNNITVKGTLNESAQTITINPVMDDNMNHIKLFIIHYLKKNGIKLIGKILPSTQAPTGQVVAKNKRNIKEVYKTILKKSDNYLSDYLFQLITEKCQCDEWFEGGDYVKQYAAQKFNIDLDNAVIMDGSGISRLNMLSPNQMSDLLQSIAAKGYFNNFKDYLAQPDNDNEDSTLKDRFKDFPYKIYAKTGSMRGIHSLVGYLNKGAEVLSFVVVSNNAVGSKDKILKIEEEIIKAIAE